MSFLHDLTFGEQPQDQWTGLEERPDWYDFDSSKLQCYMQCPRRYFYEYVCGWKPDVQSNHLVFGQAWHEAMEYLLLHGYSDDAIIGAYDKFLTCYREHFPESTDEAFAPKTPANALKALAQYCERYKDDNFEVLHTELGGRLSLDFESPHLAIIYKIDALVRHEGQVVVLEHKTKGGSFSQWWADQWKTSFQIGTYTFAAKCLYEDANNVIVNGTGFLKTRIDFMRIPVTKTEPQINMWYKLAIFYIRQILWDIDILQEALRKGGDMSAAFIPNPTACTNFFGCPYVDLCLSWENPLDHIHRLPSGFHIEIWNPLERVKHKQDLNLNP